MRENALLRRLLAGATVLAMSGAVLIAGADAASAQPNPQPEPSGPITFTPAGGNQISFFQGVTAGPCNVGEPDGYNSVILGPGVFASSRDTGNPDGRTYSSTEDLPNRTDPVTFVNRLNFSDLASEAGGPLLPGEYTVTLRCVDQFLGTIFQSYRTTLDIATASDGNFAITVRNPATPTPTVSVTPTPTVTPIPTATATPTASATPTPTVTATPTATATPTVTPTPSATPIPSATPTPTSTATPTPTSTATPTVVPSPSPGSPRATRTRLVVFPNPAEDLVILLARADPWNARGRIQFALDGEDLGRAQRTFFGFALQCALLDDGEYVATATFNPRNPNRFGGSTSEPVTVQVGSDEQT